MNQLSIAGRVGSVRDIAYTQGGDAVLNFTVAVDRGARDGEKLPPLWVSVALWGKQAEALAKYIRKGDPIAVSGQADVRTYESNGETKAELQLKFGRVTLLGSKRENTDEERPARSKSRGRPAEREEEPADESGDDSGWGDQ